MMLSNDCLGWSDEEEDYLETERSRRMSVPRKRSISARTSSASTGRKDQGSVAKRKRRSGETLTIEDIPAIVKAVVDLSCHRWSPKNWSPRTICVNFSCHRWSPRTKYGCHGWSGRTIYGAMGGPPWPQMVPLSKIIQARSWWSSWSSVPHIAKFSLLQSCFSLLVSIIARPK